MRNGHPGFLIAGVALLALACGGRSGLYPASPDAAAGRPGLRIPPGGLTALLGDGGLPNIGAIGDMVCGARIKTGDRCTGDVPGCVLPSLGGVCACLGNIWMCPQNTSAGPAACPAGAASGKPCTAMLTTCLGGGSSVGCLCGVGSYYCF